MLESIQVTEQLYRPELETSKKYLLSPMEKPVSPSQVHLECVSSGVLKNLFNTGTRSHNMLLRKEADEQKNPKHSLYNCPKKAQRVSTATHRTRPQPTLAPLALSGLTVGCRDARHAQSVFTCFSTSCSRQMNSISVIGSGIRLSPCPMPRPQNSCLAGFPGTKLPQLSRACLAGRDGENSIKKLCILTAIKPSNVEKERARFFKSEFNYNPQFEYSNPVPPQVLAKQSNASDRFLNQAVRIMELALQKYGSYEKFEQATGGNLLTKSRICYHVKKYMEKEGCMGEIVVHLTDDLLSRASMTVVNSRPTLTINICTAREQWLEGMLRHEIGTHYFRGINNSHQPWSSSEGRKKHSLRPMNPTEEGLASIHSVLFRKDPTLWRAALLYYTVYQASRMSFSQLFHNLDRFVHDPNTRWDYCVRAKRGQTDTAQLGCFSKDQVYLDGILKILRHRHNIDFQLLMALGKVSYEDVECLKGLALMERVRIPHFLQDRVRYTEQLQKIMEVNQLTDEELCMLI
ncbi:putative tyrosine carboxypeptidase MATCAP2 isoform X1 [Xyrauchen texanus]|uniref:putative tyrosine carboxypeptidase MATCAP2 isoform X1 n=2 Tax=Xyrauchen texanus TaxID=154827 RepID=UPI002241BA1F|nr:putative tyrosine carboxypeptidase MATCAP2 isoform X1 [Xyrauchen texanus]